MITTIFKFLFASMFFTSLMSAAQNGTVAGALGEGEHATYDLNVWKGKEQLITKLTKGGELFEFVRVSKEEFQIRQAGEEGEIFFKFSTEFDDRGVILEQGKMVDILRSQDTVTALFYGNSGYFLIEASNKPPELKKSQVRLIPKPVRVHNWTRTFRVWATDYYADTDIGDEISHKVTSAKLADFRKIEFIHRDRNGKATPADIFTFQGETLYKNGKEHRKVPVNNFITEEGELLSNFERALHDVNIRAKFLKYFDKAELISVFSNASTPQIQERLMELVEKVYEQPKK